MIILGQILASIWPKYDITHKTHPYLGAICNA